MRYAWKERGKEGEIYSCDKVILTFSLRFGEGQGMLDALRGALWMEFDHWTSAKFNAYRNQFSIKVGDASFWLGVGLLEPGKGRPSDTAKLEFNPNKVWPSRPLCWVLRQLWQRVRLVEPVRLKQWDLAVDFAGRREDFTLCKDGRLYEERARSSSDRTQYVGQRNKPGRVKLYNKQLEAGLDEPLTRLELTVEGLAGPDVVAAVWPVVYRLGTAQITTEMAALNDTDRFIFATLLQQPDRIRELGRRKRDKMATLLAACGWRVEFDREAYKRLLGFVARFADNGGPRLDALDRAAWEWPEQMGPVDDWQ